MPWVAPSGPPASYWTNPTDLPPRISWFFSVNSSNAAFILEGFSTLISQIFAALNSSVSPLDQETTDKRELSCGFGKVKLLNWPKKLLQAPSGLCSTSPQLEGSP